MSKYVFVTYFFGDSEHYDYIEADSRYEAEETLKEMYWPDLIDYKYLREE